MSRSSDPGHFFQTTTSLAEAERKASKSKNTLGNPIKLPSKILAVTADPDRAGCVYVAEAAGTVRKVVLEVCETASTFTGPAAPVTCLALSSSQPRTLFAGCWDKAIWSWSADTRKPACRYLGHGDFVKALLCFNISGRELLVSGSADASIIVWDVASGAQLHQLKGHARGILALAVDPLSFPTVGEGEERGEKVVVTVFSAGSDREIRRWKIGASEAFEEPFESKDGATPLLAHETSVNALYFDVDGDLWTASADKTAKCLVRERNWEADAEFAHPDFVRDVVVDNKGGWAVTACRDEEVRVWERGSGKLYHTFEGHFEEVTALALLPGQKIVSVSIDATIRQWSLSPQDLRKAIEDAERAKRGEIGENVEKAKESLLTEDEERELAELMEDSE